MFPPSGAGLGFFMAQLNQSYSLCSTIRQPGWTGRVTGGLDNSADMNLRKRGVRGGCAMQMFPVLKAHCAEGRRTLLIAVLSHDAFRPNIGLPDE
jgi:hypothetical protein